MNSLSYIQNKQRMFQQQIRYKFLNQYFQQIRLRKLKEDTQPFEIHEDEIKKFTEGFPTNLNDISLDKLPSRFIQRLSQRPYYWLINCERVLNLCQWSSLVQLLLRILNILQTPQNRISLIESARRLICFDYKKRLSSNKIMKKSILSLTLDLFVEIRTHIEYLGEQYVLIMQLVLKQTFSLKWQQNQEQIIKALAICNEAIIKEKITNIIHRLFIQEKYTVVKMTAFMQEYSCFCDNLANTLIQIILICLVNYTQSSFRSAKFYSILEKFKFKEMIHSLLCVGSSFKQLELLLKLIHNLIIDEPAFAQWFASTVNLDNLYSHMEQVQLLQLLHDIKTLLNNDKMMAV